MMDNQVFILQFTICPEDLLTENLLTDSLRRHLWNLLIQHFSQDLAVHCLLNSRILQTPSYHHVNKARVMGFHVGNVISLPQSQ